MKIAFTLCSNNYLAQAKTLGDSFLDHNPNYKFIIGLVDEFHPAIDYSFFSRFEILTIEKVIGEEVDELWKKYDIIELNTCVKPSYFLYLFESYENVDQIFYFDPDIMIFTSLSMLENEFKDQIKILLTPHIFTPISLDEHLPSENTFLNYGIYNLGFLGLSRDIQVNVFLEWWKERTLSRGYNKSCEGLFVDQLWINLVPIFFGKTKILLDPGYNMAPWNLHERKLTYANEIINVNNEPLYFYHFSSYNFKIPERLSNGYSRYTFENHQDVKGIYESYWQLLVKNSIESFSPITCSYLNKRHGYLMEQKRLKETKIPWIKRKLSKIANLKLKELLKFEV